MKALFALFSAMLVSTAAFAFVPDFSQPDFEMIRNHERAVIARDAGVLSYVRSLGARSFKVTNGKPELLMYGVVTDNGCSFDVEVVYNSWPGIDDVIVSHNAVCR